MNFNIDKKYLQSYYTEAISTKRNEHTGSACQRAFNAEQGLNNDLFDMHH